MIDLSIIFVVSVVALLAVQAMDIECTNPPARRRVKGRATRDSAYVPANSVTN